MKIPKEIQILPWPEAAGQSDKINFFVSAEKLTIRDEEWLAVSFVPNPVKYGNSWIIVPSGGFRAVCRKGAEKSDADVMWRGGRAKSHDLRQAMSPYSTNPESCCTKLSKGDKETIAGFLGMESRPQKRLMHELDAWIRSARDEAENRRRVAAGELDDGDYALCPKELPPGLEEFVRRMMLRSDRFILYKHGNLSGTCCLCGAHITAGEAGKRFKQGEFAICPACGEELQCVLMGGASFESNYVGNIATVQRGRDGATVFVRFWHLMRDNSAEWKDIPGKLKEIVRWGIRGNKAAKWEAEHKYNYCMSTWREDLDGWTRVNGKINDFPDYRYYFYLPENWRDIFAGTGLRYCEAAQYERSTGKKNMIRFLLDWARYPAIELYWKAGYKRVVGERVTGRETRNAVNWRKHSIRDSLEFPARFLKLLPREDWTTNRISRMADLWKIITGSLDYPEPVKLKDEELVALITSENVVLKWIYPALGKAPAGKIVEYAEKQGISLYRDYLEECRELQMGLKNRQILFPQNFSEAHARTAELVAIREKKIDMEKFRKRSVALERYIYSESGILIRPAATPAELIREGTALSHCVGRYAKSMSEGETAIFFVRREDEPEKPWYTLELRRGKVVQCRTRYNASYETCPEVLEFVGRWLNYIKKVDRKKAAGTPAA